jgi:rubrerythrin
MISTETLSIEWLVRLAAPLVWRSNARAAKKLEGFAATEAGSALDMLKAAELTTDRRLRRLFFRHALDEARHAQLFREAARRLDPDPRHRASEYNLIHATRQNLYQRLGLVGFVAFVYLAEKRGEAQFRALARHFDGDLAALFRRISKDERFHVAYSGRLLKQWRRAGKKREVRRALLRVRIDRARQAWLRAGRLLADGLSRVLLSLVYLLALPLFALAQRLGDPERVGWKQRKLPASVDAARRQF